MAHSQDCDELWHSNLAGRQRDVLYTVQRYRCRRRGYSSTCCTFRGLSRRVRGRWRARSRGRGQRTCLDGNRPVPHIHQSVPDTLDEKRVLHRAFIGTTGSAHALPDQRSKRAVNGREELRVRQEALCLAGTLLRRGTCAHALAPNRGALGRLLGSRCLLGKCGSFAREVGVVMEERRGEARLGPMAQNVGVRDGSVWWRLRQVHSREVYEVQLVATGAIAILACGPLTWGWARDGRRRKRNRTRR